MRNGGSVSAGPSLGAEYNIIVDKENNKSYHGGTFQFGAGVSIIPVEFHGEVGNTWVVGYNIFDAAIGFINWITPE